MKNPIRISTNQSRNLNYDVYLYDDDTEEIRRSKDFSEKRTKILFAGKVQDLENQAGKIEIGTKVKFREEGSSDKIRFGTIIKIEPTPYRIIKEDGTNYQYSVHKKYIESRELTFKQLAEKFIEKFSDHRYRKYDLGVVKIQQKTYETPEESLKDLASKADYILMITKSKK